AERPAAPGARAPPSGAPASRGRALSSTRRHASPRRRRLDDRCVRRTPPASNGYARAMAAPSQGPVAQASQPSAPPASALPATGPALHARQRLDAGRAEIFARHRAGAGGQQVVRAISDLTDSVLQEMFASLAAERGAASDLALVATGGYGRRELSPRS